MRQRLLELLKNKAYQKKEVELSSGKKSNFYIDVRRVSLSPEGLYMIASLFFDYLKDKQVTAIGGPTLGADPIIGGVCFLAGQKGKSLSGFLVRKTPKKHGQRRLIEGPRIKENSKVILCDDVATSGKSLLAAKEVVEQEGLVVSEFMVVVDRSEGAKETLVKAGYNLFSLYKKSDFLT